jgi:hypothetical protein
MYVDRPRCIELHVRETVQIDRLQPMGVNEYVAERHGTLLAPGVTQVQLEQGIYHLRTLDDAQLRIISGGVQVTSTSTDLVQCRHEAAAHEALAVGRLCPVCGQPIEGPPVGKIPIGLGQGPCGHLPALRVIDATAGAR